MSKLAQPRTWLAAQLVAVRRHSPRVWMLWVVGATAALAVSFALADPGLLVLALDPELIALIVLSSLALLRASGPALLLSMVALGESLLDRVRVVHSHLSDSQPTGGGPSDAP